ncbi:sorting nexin-19 [Siniperca chuatsi]|uniref:sorting nexin-19 n=1 Tax=Siniperca chuatsi TaxID=119488 RepID=UPI001CE0AA6B|nr:sorting nexin-19 [Siniperca chuatsi]XP_044059657.1 sorting nexin-19 [Siniperca chuatsi]
MISTSLPEGVKPDSNPHSAMAEVLGQRSLLGFGVVLAWLVLFHLLVNIWLLCVFTSLLVVLGGWLGSQAVLESNSVVHLERFITLEQVPPSVEDEHHLDREIHNTVRKIIRDFVTSWYSTVSSESGFETEVRQAMISMAMELKIRARQVDRKELTQRILDLFGCHLQDYSRAKELVTEQQTPLWSGESEQLWKAYSRVTAPHLAMTSDTVEVNYTRAVVDLLLHVLVPSPHLETCTGRFVVGELITCNVLLPLIAKLSDPDWLNSLLIEIFGKSSKPQEPITTEPLTSSPPLPQPPAQSELAPLQETTYVPQKNNEDPLRAETDMVNDTETTPELAAYDVIDSEEVDCPQNNTEEEEPTLPFLRHYMRGSKSNPFYQENDSDLDSPVSDYKQSCIESLVMIGQEEGLYDRQKECAMSDEKNNGMDLEDVCPSPVDGCCPKVLVNSEPVEHPNGCGPSSVRTAEGTPTISSLQDLEREGSSPSVNPARELLLGVEQTGLGNPNELTEVSPLQGSSPMPSFSFEPLSSPDGPVIIQNLRITGTITAKEHRGTGSHPYTLYTIKYETAMGCENPGSIQPGSEDAEVVPSGCENPSPIQPVAYHMVNRRYSEFLNLQTRLEEKTELRKLIKGVKGPKKIFPDMPFGNMDSEKIEARKGLLETFLKQLCAISEIANSEEMQEFLALNTDARIAFVKKPFIVSRIDKIVVNAIVDTLKTAFPRSEPQSPTEDNEGEVDGGKISADKKSKSRLKFSSKNIPFMNGSDMRPAVLFSCEQTSTVFNGMSLGDLQAFITEQEKRAIRAEPEREDSPVVREFGCYLDDSLRGEHSQEPASETALAEVALNILCLLMKKQWSWLCTENIQRTIRLLFGTLINRWLDVSVANLTCTRYWVVYLQVIQEAVWPGGALPAAPQLERSQQQKDITRQQALHCLMRLLPDLVSDMLGSDKYKLSWQTALDSLQDPYINRHLVYCIFDLLLEFLVPEIPEEDFQRRLLQTLSKNPEKLLA